MDLTSDNPFWLLKNGLLANYPALARDTVCDVLIIGGGITGALIADQFIAAGISTVILDLRDIGQGSTCATTALLQYEIDTHLCDLSLMVGQEHAESAYRLCFNSIQQLEDRIGSLSDTCGYERKKSIYLATDRQAAEELKAECEARLKCGISVEYLTQDQVRTRFDLTAFAALVSSEAAQLDAFRLTHRLIQANLQRGLAVFDRTEAVKFDPCSSGVLVTTNRDAIISARKVIFATGYESQALLKQRVCKLKSTYALVTQPLPDLIGWPREYLLWESSRPYSYLRSTDDQRILIGGEDDDFRNPLRRDASISKKTKLLLKRLKELLPSVNAEAEYAWAGTFGETKDGLPYIGESAEFPNAYFGLGFGGNGITFSIIAAEILLDLYLEKDNPAAQIFRFDR